MYQWTVSEAQKKKEKKLDKHDCDLAVSPWTAWKDGQKETVDWTLDSGSLPPGRIQHPSYLTCFL